MNISAPHSDYLGQTWQARTIFLRDDDALAPRKHPDVAVITHEEDAATLISRSAIAALYLPGFHDTFFHTEQAAAWREHSIPLFGLDYRRSGRALRQESSRDNIRDLLIREEEISSALTYIRELGAKKIILIGHSTGGLQAALWASRNPDSVDLVILNSPWLDHNGSDFARGILTDVIIAFGCTAPRACIGILGSAYARSLHCHTGGEFYFDTRHKTLKPIRVYAGFLRSVRLYQRAIARGEYPISVPLLIAHSDRAGNSFTPSAEELANADCVLNPEDMVRLGKVLSPSVEFLKIPGGRHDLALSTKPARNLYTRETIAWARRNLGF